MIFEDVVGQGHVTETLRNAIASNRVAHAYIFSGTRGCGKTTTARIFARALNCSSPVNQNPDNMCEICKEIIDGRGMDVIEIDGASNRGVEEIRNLRDSVRYAPQRGKYKVYIIDEVHMLTKEAFNALLKTLEEPPAHVVFIFATTEVHKVPMTILSRCQRFDFRRIAAEEIIKTLSAIAQAEEITIDRESLMIIAKRADGSLRDSESIFDQVRAFCGNDIQASALLKAFNVVDQDLYFRVTDFLKMKNAGAAVALVEEIMKNGYDLREFVGGLAEHFRNLLVVRATGSTQLLESSDQVKERYESEAKKFPEEDVLRYIKQVNELEQSLRWAAQPRYLLEAALLQMVSMEGSQNLHDLLQRFEELKKKLDAGITPSFAPVPPVQAVALPLSTEVQIRGEASAGYLKSKSAHSYSSLIGTDLGRLAGVPRTSSSLFAPVSQTQSASSSPAHAQTFITKEDVLEHWKNFVNDVAREKIAVGTSLREAQILDIQNGYLRISCPGDYNYSSLKRNKDFLSEKLGKASGKHVIVEPVLQTPGETVSVEKERVENTPKTKQEPAGRGSPEVDHPVLQILKRELDAERME
jgi:DNA polymerase-3 subunit gamma/tau